MPDLFADYGGGRGQASGDLFPEFRHPASGGVAGLPSWAGGEGAGGGWLGSLEGALGVGGIYNPLNWLGHLARDVPTILHEAPLAVAGTLRAGYEDLLKYGNLPAAAERASRGGDPYPGGSHLAGDIIRPAIEGSLQTWDVRDPHRFIEQTYQHPLYPALDVLSLVSGGSAGLVRLGRAAEFAGRFPETASGFERAAAALPGSERAARYARSVEEPRFGYLASEDPAWHAERGLQLYQQIGPGPYDFKPVTADEASQIADAGGRLYQRFETRKSMTPYGRAFDRMVDRLGLSHPLWRGIGNVSRSARAEDRILRMTRADYQAKVRAFRNSTAHLSKDERFAYHLALENGPRDFSGVPAALADAWTTYHDTKLGYSTDPLTGERVQVDVPQESHALRGYMEGLLRKPWREIEPEMTAAIRRHQGDVTAAARELGEASPVDAVLRQAPRPEFEHALELGRELQREGAQIYAEAGVVPPAVAEARRYLAARVRSGARYQPGRVVPVGRYAPLEGAVSDVTAQMRSLDREIRSARAELDKANQAAERASSVRANLKPPPDLEALVARHDQALERLRHAEADLLSAQERTVGRTEQQFQGRVRSERGLVLEGQRLPEAEAEVRSARAELARAEHEARSVRAAAGRSVDRLEAAKERMIRAPGGGRGADSAYAALEHATAEHDRLGRRVSELRVQVEELRARRDRAELAADEARNAAALLRHRERRHQLAVREAGAARPAMERARGELARVRGKAEEAQAELERRQAHAEQIATHQARLTERRRLLDEQRSSLEQERMWQTHGTPQGQAGSTALTRSQKEQVIADQGFTTNRAVESQGVSEPREAVIPPGYVGGRTVEELSWERWAEVNGISDLWDVHPAYGMPERFPHTGIEDPLERVVRQVTGTPTRPPRLPGNARLNRAIRLLSARFIADPSIAISRDFLRTAGYAMVRDMRRWLESRSAALTDVGDGLGNTTAKDREWTYFYDGQARVLEALQRDRAVLAGGARPSDISDAARMAVWDPGADARLEDWLSKVFGPSDAEARDLRWMRENGIRRVRSKDASRLLKESKAADTVGWKWWDRAMDVWRALVLSYRPAWLAYNIVGQHLLYMITYGGPAGARAYLDGLVTEKVKHPTTGADVPFLQMRRLAVTRRQRKLAAQIEAVAPGNFFSTIAETRSDTGRIWLGDNALSARIDALRDADWGLSARHPARSAGKLSVAATEVGVAAVLSVKDAINYLNFKVADDIPRTAAFAREAKRDRTIAEIRRQAQEFEGVNLSLGEALKRADRATIMRLMDNVDRALGNFLDMGAFERRWIRRFIPFYSWFKVISRITARLGVDHPGRVNLLHKLAAAAGTNPALLPAGPVPSYLQGAIALGAPQGEDQNLLVTSGLNPFETVNQLIGAGGELLHGQARNAAGELVTTSAGSSSPYGFFGPATGGVIAGFGIDPFYGSNYRGPGAGYGTVPQILGYEFSSLPQYRLADQLSGGQQSALYDPNARLGPIPYPLLAYLGLPVRRVNLPEAASRAEAGQ